MKKILEGVVVLDLTRFFSGPQATLILAGLGAEVFKIDDPHGGDPTAFAPPFAGPEGVSFTRQTDQDMGIAYLKRARGKKSITLNLKSQQGRAIFLSMVAQADVVIENFSVGVTQRLGIDYDALREVNPRIVHCSLTGYGSTGPDKNLKAYDLMVQAAVGLMTITGVPDSPPVKTGSPLSDAIAGSFAAMGVIAALYHRDRTGEGQTVDVSMADCLLSLMLDEPLDCYERLGLKFQQGNRIMRFSPFNTYRTRDGWIAVGVATQADWMALQAVMVRSDSDLVLRPELSQLAWRLEHNEEVDAIIAEWIRTLDTATLVDLLGAANVPCSPVRTIDDVMNWQQMHARGMITPLVNPLSGTTIAASGPGFPIKFGLTPACYDRPAPIPGEHTHEVMSRLAGLTSEQLEQLQRDNVI